MMAGVLVGRVADRRHKACGLLALLVGGQGLLDKMLAVRVQQTKKAAGRWSGSMQW